MRPPEIEDHKFKQTDAPVTTSWRLIELRAAKEWGMNPGTFDALPVDTRAEMIASGWVTNMIDRYQFDMSDKKKPKDIRARRNLQ